MGSPLPSWPVHETCIRTVKRNNRCDDYWSRHVRAPAFWLFFFLKSLVFKSYIGEVFQTAKPVPPLVTAWIKVNIARHQLSLQNRESYCSFLLHFAAGYKAHVQQGFQVDLLDAWRHEQKVVLFFSLNATPVSTAACARLLDPTSKGPQILLQCGNHQFEGRESDRWLPQKCGYFPGRKCLEISERKYE